MILVCAVISPYFFLTDILYLVEEKIMNKKMFVSPKIITIWETILFQTQPLIIPAEYLLQCES